MVELGTGNWVLKNIQTETAKNLMVLVNLDQTPP